MLAGSPKRALVALGFSWAKKKKRNGFPQKWKSQVLDDFRRTRKSKAPALLLSQATPSSSDSTSGIEPLTRVPARETPWQPKETQGKLKPNGNPMKTQGNPMATQWKPQENPMKTKKTQWKPRKPNGNQENPTETPRKPNENPMETPKKPNENPMETPGTPKQTQ